jgi:hypothetical protein
MFETLRLPGVSTTDGWVDNLHPVLGLQKLWTTSVVWHKITIKKSDTDDLFTLAMQSYSLYVHWQGQ